MNDKKNQTVPSDIEQMLLNDYRLTTAEIVYHLPDFPLLLQSYTWQELDLCPDFPELQGFLNFWERDLEGKIHSVQVASCEIIAATDYTHCIGQHRIH